MIVSLMTGTKTHRTFRTIAIQPDVVAAVTLLDPMEIDGESACILTLKQPVAVGLTKDKKPDMQSVFIVADNVYEVATMAGLHDPEQQY